MGSDAAVGDVLALRVDVPMAGLRPMWAREYQETYPVPPPSTVYGMLLSLVGVEREDKDRHAGLRIALALAGSTEKGRVFRKFRRWPQSKKVPESEKSDPLGYRLGYRRPDYQELLLGLKFWVWIADSKAAHPLVDRIRMALDPERRGEIVRHGALCLGESSHMVNAISVDRPRGQGRFVAPSEQGLLSMPVWSDHRKDRPTLLNFDIRDSEELAGNPPDDCWIAVAPR